MMWVGLYAAQACIGKVGLDGGQEGIVLLLGKGLTALSHSMMKRQKFFEKN